MENRKKIIVTYKSCKFMQTVDYVENTRSTENVLELTSDIKHINVSKLILGGNASPKVTKR